jgi:2-dehydropantoate 2-reductase
LLKGLGYPIYPRSKARLSACPTSVLAAMLWSMSRIRPYREIAATGENECRALVDMMAAAAPRANPPVDVSKIKAIKPA